MMVDLDNMPHIIPVCDISNAQISAHARRVARKGGDCPFDPDSPLWQKWIDVYFSELLIIKINRRKDKVTS